SFLVDPAGPVDLGNGVHGRWITTRTATYDSLGNKLVVFAGGITRSYQYDATRLHPISETVEPVAGQPLSWSADWDFVIGQPIGITDPNGIRTAIAYDSLGRVASEAIGDAPPHLQYEYQWSSPRPKTITYSFMGALSDLAARPTAWTPG